MLLVSWFKTNAKVRNIKNTAGKSASAQFGTDLLYPLKTGLQGEKGPKKTKGRPHLARIVGKWQSSVDHFHDYNLQKVIYFIHRVWLIWWCWGVGGFRLLRPKKTSAYLNSKHEITAIQSNLMKGPFKLGTYWRLCLVFTRWLSFPCFAVSLVRSLMGRKGR